MGDIDLAIVGAGISGLAAAAEASRRGLKVAVLEAGGRIGGRAFTESASLGVPFDHGCHFLHAASKNPFLTIAGELGFRYRRGGYKQRIRADGRWFLAGEASEYLDWVQSYFSDLRGQAETAGDISVEQATKHLKKWGRLFDGYYEEFLGAPASEVGLLDHSTYVDTFEDWPVLEGFGSLVARHFQRIPVQLECTVRHIKYDKSDVTVETDRGPVNARAVLVTVSTGVLAAEQIKFSPSLPDWKLSAIQSVPMGYAGKVGFRLADAQKTPEPVHVLASAADGRFANIHIRPFSKPVIVVIVAGHDWKEFELAGPEAMIDAAREMIGEAMGTSVRRYLGAAVSTIWQRNSRFLGGHSYRLPGDPDARHRLGTSLRGRVFFAGEATSSEAWATAHGAYQSGQDAIDKIIGAFNRRAARRKAKRASSRKGMGGNDA